MLVYHCLNERTIHDNSIMGTAKVQCLVEQMVQVKILHC